MVGERGSEEGRRGENVIKMEQTELKTFQSHSMGVVPENSTHVPTINAESVQIPYGIP